LFFSLFFLPVALSDRTLLSKFGAMLLVLEHVEATF
jgi:hypothetical protein